MGGGACRTSTQSGSPWLLFPLAVRLYVDPAVAEVCAQVTGSTQCARVPGRPSSIWSIVTVVAFGRYSTARDDPEPESGVRDAPDVGVPDPE